jgi:hypothetical protein
MLLGLFATTLGGLQAVGVANQTHLDGATVSGLLSLGAGLVALIVGGRLLWQSRPETATVRLGMRGAP